MKYSVGDLFVYNGNYSGIKEYHVCVDLNSDGYKLVSRNTSFATTAWISEYTSQTKYWTVIPKTNPNNIMKQIIA